MHEVVCAEHVHRESLQYAICKGHYLEVYCETRVAVLPCAASGFGNRYAIDEINRIGHTVYSQYREQRAEDLVFHDCYIRRYIGHDCW